ncbi:hypothetical protein [Clostridium estertheticum]|uniref:hypothetical protein n=1 Tax=Clostridium estertheticum TaxID=238834 RepID=UPI001C0DE18E|nr:hypothetical protein [Clostridium estertheticum]MBU3173282.1 hypothetical protein [Clostridium estertheticum]
MTAIAFITGWVKYMFIIIPVGATAMVTYQSVRKSLADDDGTASDANNKVKQTIKGAIIGMSLSGLITILQTFYK